MKQQNDALDYSGWLADLAAGELTGDALKILLATRITSIEEVERAAKEVVISRRIRQLMINLQKAEIKVPANFEARLMTRISEDETLLNLLEVYLTGLGQALIELINILFSFLPEPEEQEVEAV
jgi:hypothetical protein